MPYILVGQIEGQIVQHHLKNGEIHIGREPDNDIVLNLKTVSRYHAIIQVDGSQISIKDLDSSNGTFIYPNDAKPYHVKQQEAYLEGSGALCLGADSGADDAQAVHYRVKDTS